MENTKKFENNSHFAQLCLKSLRVAETGLKNLYIILKWPYFHIRLTFWSYLTHLSNIIVLWDMWALRIGVLILFRSCVSHCKNAPSAILKTSI